MDFNEFLTYICKELKIPLPEILPDEGTLLTDTQMASVNVKEGIIYLRKDTIINLDTLFSVAHELRHLWQFKKPFWRKLIESHIQNDEIDPREYNLQSEEIDANAYGAYIMMKLFKAKPTFDNLDSDIVECIYERVEEIKSDRPLS